MKKIALVAALAAISASAFAQSSVTLYGRVNTSVESQKVGDGQRSTVVQNNNSRWGLLGSEDLGGGLKTTFNLEGNFDSTNGTLRSSNGTAKLFDRASYVQLAGDFGAIRVGNWFPGSYFAVVDAVSNHNHDTGTSSDALFAYGINFTTTTSKVAYITPTIEGFSAELSARASQGNQVRAFDASGVYDQGPVHLGAGYSKQGGNNQYSLRASYDFGDIIVGGYVMREELSDATAGTPMYCALAGGATTCGTRNIYRLSAQYNLGQSEFHVNVGQSDAFSNVSNSGGTQWTLAYNYNLSKRTKIYAFYTALNNQSNGAFAAVGAQGVGQDFNSFAMGIRHNF